MTAAAPVARPKFDRLLISDVDGTLLPPPSHPDPAPLRDFAAFYEAKRAAGELGLVLSSGRFAASVLESVAATDLPTPDAVIGGVGTEIYLRDERGEFPEPLADWPATFRDWDAEAVRFALAVLPKLIPQPEEFQSDYKASYYFRRATADDLAAVERRLADAGVAARVVYSSDRDLDVLPAAADKGNAAVFLSEYFGVPPHRVVVAGDSGNDAATFRGEFRAIAVANSLPELLNCDHPHVYRADGVAAAGVLEGVKHWSGW